MPEGHEAIVVYGTTWCPDCRRAKQSLGDHRFHCWGGGNPGLWNGAGVIAAGAWGKD